MAIADPITRSLYRILDANLDRAREGLRTLEEWARFGLERSDWVQDFKDMRQTLARFHRDEYRSARDTTHDPGTTLSHPGEEQRSDIPAVLRANFARVQEALRVLEEYAKVSATDLASAAKQLRYRLYELESHLVHQDRLQRLFKQRLYLVTSPHPQLLEVVEAALKGGLRLVQYRDKTSEDLVRLERALQLRELCRRYEALFLINDRVDLALAVDSDGVHLGQQDVPIALARRVLGPDRIIGRSTTNPEEMAKALAEGADYIGVGPVFATPTKPGKAAAGFDYVRYVQAKATVPCFAIGGIDLTNVSQVLAAGAERVAVVRAIMEAPDPTQVTQALLERLTSGTP
jgi:thiamine-phosphate pyrophosphorylase